MDKEINSFEWQKERPNPRTTCKVCRESSRDKVKERERHKEYMRNRRKTNPNQVRINWEKSVYGYSKEDFNYSKCYICGSEDNLCIDHNHKNDEVRGLLCGHCNKGLGMFRDNINLLNKAISYLKDGPHFELYKDEK